jgi:hypothetical protein
VDRHAYIASRLPLLFDEARLPFSPAEFVTYVEADRETIRTNTAAAPLNRDLSPNSEYYVTYPYAWSLTSIVPADRVYTERIKSRFMALLWHADKATASRPVVAR